MTTQKTTRLAPTLLALAILAPVAGCDWFDPSGSTSRLSPEISALQIAPPSDPCDQPVLISFRFSDPQDDLDRLLLDFRHASLDEQFTRSVSWGDPDLTVTEDIAVYRFVFACRDHSAGDWTISVQVEDRGGHLSNVLEGDFFLTSSR